MSMPMAAGEPRKGSWLRTAMAVGSSFIGIRKGSASQEDLGKLNPFHIIAVAIAGVALLVVGLIVLVNWVAR